MPLTAPLSFQLYSGRNFPPLAQQLMTLKRIGYTNVEPFGGLYDDLEGLERGLKENGLTAQSGHFALDMLENENGRALEIAKRLGMNTIIIPYIQPQDRPGDRDGWQRYGERVARAGDSVRAAGLRFAYHNHDFEFRPLSDGTLPFEHLMQDGVLWEADLAWVVKADADPKPWLERFKGRVPFIHVKDIAPTGEKTDEDGWADVGEGTLDWSALWRAAVFAGAEVMVAEHDNPSDGERFARVSAAAMAGFAKESA